MAYYNEIDPFCCEVLRARIADGRLPSGQVDGRDVREVRPDEIPAGQVHLFAGIGGFAVAARLAGLPDDFDIWTAGFPCQDISTAGKGAGLSGTRSGLFFEIVRLLRGVQRRPSWVLLENVPALRTRGFDRVAAEMEELGYAVGEVVVGAWAVGAPHKRNRAWIVCRLADARCGPSDGRVHGEGPEQARQGQPTASGASRLADTGCEHGRTRGQVAGEHETAGGNPSCSADPERPRAVADADPPGRQEHPCLTKNPREECQAPVGSRWPSRPGEPQHEWEAARLLELPLGGLVDGIPARLVRRANRDALKAYGNSIVPQVAAEIMRAMTGGPLLAAKGKT